MPKIGRIQARIVAENVELCPEQLAALKELDESGDNIFLTGKAGTGKTVLLRYFLEHTHKNVAAVAPTGIAAINIGGQTIHSFFKLNLGVQKPELAEEVYTYNDDSRELYRKIDTLVIDEASMVRADVMEMINAKLQSAREEFFEPFGGCQVIAVGDLYQLPPVGETNFDAELYLRDHYDTDYFFSAPIVKAFPFKIIELQQIHRQDDSHFIDILNRIRTGDVDHETMKAINDRCREIADEDDLVTLTTTNERADQINEEHLNALEGEEHVYPCLIEGFMDMNDVVADELLRLKPGAKVIMIKNDPEGRWVNGTMAKIKSLSNCAVTVTIGDKEYMVDKEEWESKAYRYNRENGFLDQETTGKFYQFPVKLAYALTIHKSQGQTYDGVIIDLKKSAFATGQIYVALSRCRTINKLYLSAPLKMKEIMTDPRIQKYMDNALELL